jgi:hypothetical protein
MYRVLLYCCFYCILGLNVNPRQELKSWYSFRQRSSPATSAINGYFVGSGAYPIVSGAFGRWLFTRYLPTLYGRTTTFVILHYILGHIRQSPRNWFISIFLLYTIFFHNVHNRMSPEIIISTHRVFIIHQWFYSIGTCVVNLNVCLNTSRIA